MSGFTSGGPATPHAIASILDKYLTAESQELVKMTLVSFVAWNILNLIVMNLKMNDKHLPRNEMLDMRNRMVSFVHGLVGLFISGYNTYFVHSQCGERNTPFEQLIMSISNGYFLYDLVAMGFLGLLDV
jgi:hypothetical protein